MEGGHPQAAPDVRVVAISWPFEYRGHTYMSDDVLSVPAAHLDAWLASGRVRLLDERTAAVLDSISGEQIAEQFSGKQY
jgi:hypothetical protein